MDPNVMMVVGAIGCIDIDPTEKKKQYYNYIIQNNKICEHLFKDIFKDTGKKDVPPDLNIAYNELKKYSLVDLIDCLNILIPLIPQSYIKNIHYTIQTLNSSINNMTDDTKNIHDLIKVNQELKNKCEKLESELSAIKKIVGGS
jgi:hypothetical protein